MPRPHVSRLTVPAPLMAALVGSLAGLAVFALCAALWRAGEIRTAETAAQTAVLVALLSTAVAALTPRQRLRMLRVRVPTSRAVPLQWMPREPDMSALLAVCAGTPLLVGAAAAWVVFG